MAKKTKGNRDKGGRLKRSAREVSRLDRGSDRTRAMQERFGQHYAWALGRAYAAGLLDDPLDDKRAADRLANVTRLMAVHGRVYGKASYGKNPLDRSPGGMDVVAEMTQADRDSREWLAVNLARIEHTACGSFLDQLTSPLFVDEGPSWLEALLAVKPSERDPRDLMVLSAAIKAIDAIGSVSARQAEAVVMIRAA